MRITIHTPDNSGCHGYTIYNDDALNHVNPVVARNADNDDVEAILTKKEFKDFFDKGLHSFEVSKKKIFEQFQYLG